MKKCISFVFWKFPQNSSLSPDWYSSLHLTGIMAKELDTHTRSFLKFSHPSLLPLPTMSLLFRNWLPARTDSTAGARLSSVTKHLALEAWSRYKISFAVSWDVPGIRTIPRKKARINWEMSAFPKNTWLCLSVDADFIHHGCLAVGKQSRIDILNY